MTFEAQNELEVALVRATADPVERPRFLRCFLEAPIWIVQEGPVSATAGEHMLQPGDQLRLLPIGIDGQDWLAVYSSMERLQAGLNQPVNTLRIKARDFLEITQGANVVLNPGAEFGKYFPCHEVSALLAGNLGGGEVRIARQETSVLLGAPANPPKELMHALIRFFKQRREVRRAWIARYHEAQAGAPPHTLLGLEVDGDPRGLVVDAGVICNGIRVPEPPVDIYVIDGREGLAHYFLNTATPFYRRRWLGLF